MYTRQGLATEFEAQGRHQHQGVNPWIGHRLQVVSVGDQFTPGVAGVPVIGALLAVATQPLQVRGGARKNQRGFATGGVTDYPDLIGMDERRQQRVGQGGGDGCGNLDRTAV
ncbi:hypothetical protein D3C81_2008440 [compost metagenome]